MAKTILDLFRSQNQRTGETPEETYAVRNSKDIRISTNDPVLNATTVQAVNALRSRLGVRKGEGLVEQEATGIRPLFTISSPWIHGTETIRIGLQRTDQTEQMKAGDAGSDGILGGRIEGARNRFRQRLGYPGDLNPTSVLEAKIEETKVFESDSVKIKHEVPELLAKIRDDAAGTVLGRFLSEGGTPKQIGRRAVGSAINSVKSRVRGAIFGERGTTGFAEGGDAGGNWVSINYGAIGDDGSITDAKFDGESAIFDVQGVKYSKTFNLKEREDETTSDGINFVDAESEDGDSKDGFFGLAKKTPELIFEHEIKRPEGKKKYSQLKSDDSIEVKRGMRPGVGIPYSSHDLINRQSVSSEEELKLGDRPLDEYDFIPLKFTRISDNKTVYFRAIIDGLSETYNSSWDSAKYIGSPFSHYTYTGVDRSISFGLKIPAFNELELRKNWERFSFLASLNYPADYHGEVGYIVSPLIYFTLGSLYKRKPGFINSFSVSFDDNTPWEVGLNKTGDEPPKSLKDYKLPTIISVSLGIQFIENRKGTESYKKLYSYGPVTSEAQAST